MLDKILDLFHITTGNQKDNEALVTLATFFYKVDGRITWGEEEYMVNLLSAMEWNSNVDVAEFLQRVIPIINRVLDGPVENYMEFLANLMEDLQSDEAKARAKQIARAISDADGEISDIEVECLDYINNF